LDGKISRCGDKISYSLFGLLAEGFGKIKDNISGEFFLLQALRKIDQQLTQTWPYIYSSLSVQQRMMVERAFVICFCRFFSVGFILLRIQVAAQWA